MKTEGRLRASMKRLKSAKPSDPSVRLRERSARGQMSQDMPADSKKHAEVILLKVRFPKLWPTNVKKTAKRRPRKTVKALKATT